MTEAEKEAVRKELKYGLPICAADASKLLAEVDRLAKEVERLLGERKDGAS